MALWEEICFWYVKYLVYGQLKQYMDNEEKKRRVEFVRELLEIRDSLLHVDILSYHEVLELIKITCTMQS